MLLTILAPMIGVAGALLLSFGAWLAYPPLGYVTGGALCLCWSWLAARALVGSPHPGGGE